MAEEPRDVSFEPGEAAAVPETVVVAGNADVVVAKGKDVVRVWELESQYW